MQELKLKVRYPKRFKVTTDSDHKEAISENTRDRKFAVDAPNKVWTADITYVWTLEGWLYVAVAIDLFSRQVVDLEYSGSYAHITLQSKPQRKLLG